MYCPHCHQPVENEGLTFCLHCSQPIIKSPKPESEKKEINKDNGISSKGKVLIGIFIYTFIAFALAQSGQHKFPPGVFLLFSLLVAATVVLVLWTIWVICRFIGQSSSAVIKKVPTLISYSQDVSSGIMHVAPEFYAQAEQEILEDNVDKGLWAKSLMKAKGNEDVRKAEYIKLRGKQLQNQERGV